MIGTGFIILDRSILSTMKTYTAQIVHTKDTIQTLMKCQDRLCHPILNYIGGTGCVILVILALLLESYIGRTATGIFSFLGCLLFITNRHRPDQQTEMILQKLGGKMPSIHYSFTDTGILIKRETSQQTIPYSQITGLAENENFCFFVYDKKAAFLFEKKTADRLSELKEFLQKKTGLNWRALSKRKIKLV